MFSNETEIFGIALNEIKMFRNRSIYRNYCSAEVLRDNLIEELPLKGIGIEETIESFRENVMPYCVNDTSVNNMGFPDSGNGVAAMVGTLYSEFMQQNLINQSESSPSTTFTEISVIRWLRELVGYKNLPKSEVNSIYNIGGVITSCGTMSNTVAMMLARENKCKNTFRLGIKNTNEMKVLIPEGIGHYSINSSLMWLGVGDQVVYVKSKNYKMDLEDLEKKLIEYSGKIMACVVYAGDSRSLSIDNLIAVHDLVKKHDDSIWLHADACHGFSLAFSTKHKNKLKGIELYDSITTDPHKVLTVPYGLSTLLTKNEKVFETIDVESNLIFASDMFAIGKMTPFVGSRNASSLKLWFFIKSLGIETIGEMIDKRMELTRYFYDSIIKREEFILMNRPEMNSVMFQLKPKEILDNEIELLNDFNSNVYEEICKEGLYYLHSFPISVSCPESDIDGKRNVLRFMSGNPNLQSENIDGLIEYLVKKVKVYDKK